MTVTCSVCPLADQIARELMSPGTAQNEPWEVVSCLAHGWGTQERSLRMKRAHRRDASLMQGSLCRHRGCEAFGNQTLFSYSVQNNLASVSASGPSSTGDGQSCSSSPWRSSPWTPWGAVGARHALEGLTPIMGYHRTKEWATKEYPTREDLLLLGDCCGFQPITMESLEVMDAPLGACKSRQRQAAQISHLSFCTSAREASANWERLKAALFPCFTAVSLGLETWFSA